MRRLSVIFLLSGALLTGAGGSFLVARGTLMKWQAELEGRPPVAIIDITALAPPPAGMTTDAGQTAQVIQDAARRLSAAGYVVLDAQAVLAAPDDRYVPPPEQR